jgi:hypothetical protein
MRRALFLGLVGIVAACSADGGGVTTLAVPPGEADPVAAIEELQ